MSTPPTHPPTPPPAPAPTIYPTESESCLFNYLLSSLKHPSIPPPLDQLTLRVAGGWVRDKLLNKQSQDIDIALDKCTGVQFAEWLVQYQVSSGVSLSERK